jgi:hypothetical protein
VACEQVAAIRTVASLNRERHVVQQFIQSLEKPVHDALIKTLKITGVRYFLDKFLLCSGWHLVKATNSSPLLSYFGTEAHCYEQALTALHNFLLRSHHSNSLSHG